MRVLTIKEAEQEYDTYHSTGSFFGNAQYLFIENIPENLLFLVVNPVDRFFATREGETVYICETLRHNVRSSNKLYHLMKNVGLNAREALEFCDL